jgi:hypothetical protein
VSNVQADVWAKGRSGQVWNISPPPGYDLHTVHTTASRYIDWALPAHEFHKQVYVICGRANILLIFCLSHSLSPMNTPRHGSHSHDTNCTTLRFTLTRHKLHHATVHTHTTQTAPRYGSQSHNTNCTTLRFTLTRHKLHHATVYIHTTQTARRYGSHSHDTNCTINSPSNCVHRPLPVPNLVITCPNITYVTNISNLSL